MAPDDPRRGPRPHPGSGPGSGPGGAFGGGSGPHGGYGSGSGRSGGSGPGGGYGQGGGSGSGEGGGYGSGPRGGYGFGSGPTGGYGLGGGSGPGGGYGYAPRRRRSGGGTLVVAFLGFLAAIGVGGALAYRAMSRPAAAPVDAGAARPPARTANAADSPLYKVGRLPSTGCRGVRIVQDDARSFLRFLNSTSDCLDRAWGPGLGRVGIRFTAPRRVFWNTPGRSPCGQYPAPGVAAFYCPANGTVYIGVDDAQDAAGDLPVRYNVAYAREIAHEYGHAVQDMAGILAYAQQARASATTLPDRNAVTKRSELQAQCLSGVFMRSVRDTFPVTAAQWAEALRDSYGRGDDGRPVEEQDHGTDAHYRGWLQAGFTRGTTATCDTWAAAPAGVG